MSHYNKNSEIIVDNCCVCTDTRVPVINKEDGSVLIGEKAPTARELNKWLEEHPTWIAATPQVPDPDEHDVSFLL